MDWNNQTILSNILPQCGDILRFTNYKYKNDPYWVKIAVIEDIHAFQYASYKLRNNANFIFELFNSIIKEEFHFKIFKMDLLKYISYKLKNDFIFIKSLENKYKMSLFHYVSNKLKKTTIILSY